MLLNASGDGDGRGLEFTAGRVMVGEVMPASDCNRD